MKTDGVASFCTNDRMHRIKRDPELVAKAVKEQKKLVVLVSKMETETEENVAEIAALLASGVDASARDYNMALYYASMNYFSPLHYAARKGAIKTVELLIKHKADPNAKDRYEVTPLHLAAEKGCELCAKRLIDAGANINAKTRYPKDQKLDITMAPPVLHPHKKVNLPYTGGTTPLHLAASRNQINCVRLLMWEGADYNAVNAKLETSLFLSAAQGFKECVLTQLRNAISLPILSIPTITDETALHECLRQGEPMKECVEELVHRGSDVSFWNKKGDTPVHLALKHHWNPSIVQLLIWKGYNMNFDRPDRDGKSRYRSYCKTPLDVVVYGEPGRSENRVERDEEMATFFVKLGASHRLLDILASEMRSRDRAGPLLETVMDSFAHLPPLQYVLDREPKFENTMRLSLPNSRGGDSKERKKKKDEYRRRASLVPSLQHLARCSIRSAMRHRVRKVTCLPLPNHVKEYILLGLTIPKDLL